MDADDLCDYEDQHPSIHPTSTADLGLIPSSGPPPPGISIINSIDEAVQASYAHQYITTKSDILHDIGPDIHTPTLYLISHLISYPTSYTISDRLDCFHPWIRKLQVLSRKVKQFFKSLLPSTHLTQVQSTLLSKTY